MHNVTLAFEAAWKVLLIGLVLGAGLPTLFAKLASLSLQGRGGDPLREQWGGEGGSGRRSSGPHPPTASGGGPVPLPCRERGL